MKNPHSAAVALGAFLFASIVPGLHARQAAAPASRASQPPAANAQGATPSATSDMDRRAEAYYDFTMGHLYEGEYEASSRTEDASHALDFYKKAYALDPSSPVIGEQLAEMYFFSQRISDAVAETQELIKRDPSNVSARRLLARIYIRTLGDLSNASEQQSTVKLAVTQLQEIVRLDPSDSESAIWLARLYRLSNQHDQAAQVLRGVLARDPENEGAVQQLTQLLLDENKPDEAIVLLQQILQSAPTAGLYDQLGDSYMQLQDPARAEQAYRHAVEMEPDQSNHHQGLAQSLFDQEKYSEALAEYQKLAEMEPDEPDHYLKLSEIYRQLHQLDKAEQQVLHAKELAPGSLEVIYSEATIYESEGRYDDAIRVLSDAVAEVKGQTEVSPSRRRTLAILFQLLGQLYREADNVPAAINTFEEMVKLGPEEDRRADVLIIDTYRANRDLPHAFQEAKSALQKYPDDRGLAISEALLYGENNQADQAVQTLKPLLKNSSDDVEIYLDLAQVYQQSQRYNDAEQAIHGAEKLVEHPADREMIGFLLGGIYERQKKYDQAEQVFKGVLAINPRNAPVLNYYGYMLADRGVRLDEAVSLVQRALTEDPSNAAYLDSIGWAYYKQNHLAEAETNLRKAVEHDPHDPTIRSHLGDILAKSGRSDLAVAEWETALDGWHHALPAEYEADKVSELEQKISTLKRHLAQQKTPGETHPQ